MDELKVNGIVLNSADYKENDILITIFTAELGKIKAVLRGAKQPKAKFKFAGQPFCFAEWILVKRGEFFVVTSVTSHDVFYDLTTDYDNFIVASFMIKLCDYILKPGMINEQLLVAFLQALKAIVYDSVDAKLTYSKFMLETLRLSGYGLNFKTCGVCGLPIAGDILLSSNTNDFCCVSCGGYGKQISRKCYNLLRIIDETPFSKLASIKEKPENLQLCVEILRFDLQNVFGYRL